MPTIFGNPPSGNIHAPENGRYVSIIVVVGKRSACVSISLGEICYKDSVIKSYLGHGNKPDMNSIMPSCVTAIGAFRTSGVSLSSFDGGRLPLARNPQFDFNCTMFFRPICLLLFQGGQYRVTAVYSYKMTRITNLGS
jgi:hypothetical protein